MGFEDTQHRLQTTSKITKAWKNYTTLKFLNILTSPRTSSIRGPRERRLYFGISFNGSFVYILWVDVSTTHSHISCGFACLGGGLPFRIFSCSRSDLIMGNRIKDKEPKYWLWFFWSDACFSNTLTKLFWNAVVRFTTLIYLFYLLL